MDPSTNHPGAGAQPTQRPTLQEGVRIRFAGASPAQLLQLAATVEEEYRAEIEEYRAKIEELEGCLREVGSVRNAAATINATLPSEVFMHIVCCVEPDRAQHIRVAHDMSSITQGCPMLESLRFSAALPDAWRERIEVGTVARMPQLRALAIVDGQAPRIQTFLKCISIPPTACVRYDVVKQTGQRLSPLLPSDLSWLPMLPSNDEAELRIWSYESKSGGLPVGLLRGLAKGVETLHISTPAPTGRGWRVPTAIPTLATIFRSSTITALKVQCFSTTSHLSENKIVWIMDRFRQLQDLKVHGQHQQSFVSGLGTVDPGHLVTLKRLELGSRKPGSGELEAVVSAIASCATRGLRLDALSYLYLNYGCGDTLMGRFGLDYVALGEYRTRLEAVAGSVTLSADEANLPALPEL